jgi:large subunit ribosomal protein L31e
MANIEERIYTVPLRDAFNTERVRRAKRAVTEVRKFLQRHMKSENVIIGKTINEAVWARGAKKPPRRVRIHTVKEDEIVYAELVGVDIQTPTVDQKKARQDKQKEKKERVKQAREERKKMSIQEEVDESGKESEKAEAAKEAAEKPAEKTAEAKPVEKKKVEEKTPATNTEQKPTETKTTEKSKEN